MPKTHKRNQHKAHRVKNLADPTGLHTQKQIYSDRMELYLISIFERYERQFELLDYIVRDVENILIQIISEQCSSTYLSGIRYAERYTGEKLIMKKIDYQVKFSCLEREMAELHTQLQDLRTALKRVVDKYNDTAYFDLEEVSRVKRIFLKRIHDFVNTEISKTFIKSLKTQYGKSGYTKMKLISRVNACEECLKRNNMIIEIGKSFNGKIPPIHPNCDCTILPEV